MAGRLGFGTGVEPILSELCDEADLMISTYRGVEGTGEYWSEGFIGRNRQLEWQVWDRGPFVRGCCL